MDFYNSMLESGMICAINRLDTIVCIRKTRISLSFPLPHHQVLARLGEKMEVVEVDFSRMMHLVEECGKEGAREGEEEPQDVEQGLFGLGLLTVKRGIMPGGKMINFRWKILHLFFRNSLVRSGRHCGELQKSRGSLEGS